MAEKKSSTTRQSNASLRVARNEQNNEFYTQLGDIEQELKHYKDYFEGRTVFCNCDDPYESNFFKYFALKFNALKLKKLICTCWDGSPITGTELFPYERADDGRSHIAYKVELTEVKDLNEDGATDLNDVRKFLEENKPQRLEGHGDFRSQECIDLLKEADVVVTNPPFSLFREYVAQLVQYNKKFIIIGNMNAITYKEVFPLIKENKLWLGYGFNAGNAYFFTPFAERYGEGVLMKDTGLVKFRNVCWFTNIDHQKRHYPLDLFKRYSPKEYPKYDNYDAINVDKISNIPMDYDGVMGVPISFLDKYCPEQFEIVGMAKRGAGDPALKSKVYTKEDYPNYSDLNAGPTLFDGNGNLYNTYPRILIRKI